VTPLVGASTQPSIRTAGLPGGTSNTGTTGNRLTTHKEHTAKLAEENAALEELMTACFVDPSAEPAFFEALLGAIVYAHKPSNDRSSFIRLVQFPHPKTGALLLPFFTDLRQAQIASSPSVEIVKMTGRELFEATLGATLILNPNARYCLIYPEEVRLILAGTAIPPVQRLNNDEEDPIKLEPASGECRWLIEPLRDVFDQIDGVVSAALGQRAGTDVGKPPDLVIVVVVSAAHQERVVHAATVVLADACTDYGGNVDIGTIRPDEANSWASLPTFYARSEDIAEAKHQAIH
jgi:hypothetical protein